VERKVSPLRVEFTPRYSRGAPVETTKITVCDSPGMRVDAAKRGANVASG
jgi:hypothetical protein